MRLAIVYDWIDKWGGAERILQVLFETFTEADIYTLYADYNRAVWAKKYRKRIKTTFMQTFFNFRLPKQILAPLMPHAIESINLSNYDKVISLSSSFGKGVLTRPETIHLCYLFAPTRFLWHENNRFFSRSKFLQPFLTILRQWDVVAVSRPDKILALSEFNRRLISKYYRRESTILLPLFDPDYWRKLKKQKPNVLLPKQFFLLVARLEPNKNIEMAIEVFNQDSKKYLVIVGTGTQQRQLKQIAGKNTIFLDFVSENQLAWLYQKAKALVMPQSDDFGYTALEAIAFETPVVCSKKSGTAEFVQHGRTGYLFSPQTAAALSSALENYQTKSYNFAKFNWKRFSCKRFVENLKLNISL
jgi:glycosyltransferase involved in cell wall biosynthesis